MKLYRKIYDSIMWPIWTLLFIVMMLIYTTKILLFEDDVQEQFYNDVIVAKGYMVHFALVFYWFLFFKLYLVHALLGLV